jgi:hypothetical protein
MRHLISPVLFVIFVATPAAHAQGLADFSNISRAIGKEVSVVDRSGLIREGIVEAATADQVTLRVGSARQSFARAEIASAERLTDERIDGAALGALAGVVMHVLFPYGGCFGKSPCPFWREVALGAASGYLLDAVQSNRQPLYRAPSASAPTLKLSWRF